MTAPWGPPPTLTWFTDAGTFTGTLDQLTAHLEATRRELFQRWPDGQPVIDASDVAEPDDITEQPN